MSKRFFAAVLALGAAAAGIAAYKKFKKKDEEDELVLDFDLSSDAAEELDDLAAEAEATTVPVVEDVEDPSEKKTDEE